MKLARSAHAAQPWRIHEIAPDFRLEDVWRLPTPGGPGDFPRLVELVTSMDPAQASAAVRLLFALRWATGSLLGWDSDQGSRVRSLRDRLPADLRTKAAPGAGSSALPFTPLYRTETEYAAEIANATVHGILHLGWVADGAGGHRGQLAVLVRRNGALGAAYMAAITPLRHLVVYPALMRQIERAWQASAPGPARARS